MILKVFAVRDMKAMAFLQPFFSPAIGTAMRAFGDASNEDGSPFKKHPSDYVLFEIGEYDDSVGLLQPLTPVKMLACSADFVQAMEFVKGTKLDGADPKVIATEMVLNGKKPS